MTDMTLRDLSLMLEPEEDGDPAVHIRTGVIVTVSPLTVNLAGAVIPADSLGTVVGPVGATVTMLTRTSAAPLVLSITGAPAPWGAAWGVPAGGYAQDTDGQSSITAEVALTGLSVNVTTTTGRRYKITGSIRSGSTIITDRMILRIKEGATVLQTSEQAAGAGSDTNERPVVVSPAGGAHTYFLSLERIGAGTGAMVSSATSPAFILVEDIGPT